jgi:hypothetical protein
MRTGEPTVGERIAGAWPPTIRIIVRTMRNDELTITTCAAQTPDEPPKTPGNTSGGTTREHTSLRVAPIHLLRRSDVTIGAVSQGATGKTFRYVNKAATARAMTSHKAATARAVMNDEPAIRRIRTLRCQVDAVRPLAGAKIMHPWALIAVADPLRCR